MNKIKLDKYVVMPASKVPTNKLVRYWGILADCCLLEERFPAIIPDKDDYETNYIMAIKELYDRMHYVIDTESLEVIAEFTISELFGKSGLVHFSFSPLESPQTALYVCRTTTDRVLTDWKDSNNPTQPFIMSIAGLTPIKNIRACKFIQRVGFKEQAIIPFGAVYKGEVCGALLTVKTI